MCSFLWDLKKRAQKIVARPEDSSSVHEQMHTMEEEDQTLELVQMHHGMCIPAHLHPPTYAKKHESV